MKSSAASLDLNEQFLHALHVMEDTDKHAFITGRAGTGKSTLLQYFRNTTKKNIAVLAPTGVASVNVKGQTIHSFFGFKPDITPDMVKGIRPKEKSIYKVKVIKTLLNLYIIDKHANTMNYRDSNN